MAEAETRIGEVSRATEIAGETFSTERSIEERATEMNRRMVEEGLPFETRIEGTKLKLFDLNGKEIMAGDEGMPEAVDKSIKESVNEIKQGNATDETLMQKFRNLADRISNSSFGRSISSFVDSVSKGLRELFQPRAEQAAQVKDCPKNFTEEQAQIDASPRDVLPAGETPNELSQNELTQRMLDKLGIKEKMPSEERINKAIEDLKKEAPTEREKSTYDEIKDKFKDLLKLGALGLGGFITYEFLLKRSLQKTGCFRDEVGSLETKNGKIIELTCGKDARAAKPSYVVPISTVQCSKSQSPPAQCDTCTLSLSKLGNECPCADKDGVGSNFCSNDQLITKGGASLTYNYFVNKASIGDAFGDIINYLTNIIGKAADAAGGALDLLTQIEKFLTYGAFFVVIFLALYFIIWVISFFKGKSGGQQQYYPPPMYTAPPTYVQQPVPQPVSQKETPMPVTVASMPTLGETPLNPCDYADYKSWDSTKAGKFLENCKGKIDISQEIEEEILNKALSHSFRHRRRR